MLIKKFAILGISLPYGLSTSCFSSNTGSVVQSNGVITLFGGRSNNTCIVNTNQGQDLKYKSCSSDNSGELWEITETGKIKKQNSNRCLLIPDKSRKYQSVSVKPCDQDPDVSERQEFDIVNGRIHVRANKALCLSVVKRVKDENDKLQFLGLM